MGIMSTDLCPRGAEFTEWLQIACHGGQAPNRNQVFGYPGDSDPRGTA